MGGVGGKEGISSFENRVGTAIPGYFLGGGGKKRRGKMPKQTPPTQPKPHTNNPTPIPQIQALGLSRKEKNRKASDGK